MSSQISPIRSDDDHARALAEIEALWSAPEGSEEADRLEVLATLVDAYERERHAIELPDPVEAITFRLEQAGLDRADLAEILGGKARVSELLNRRRPLSLRMIRALHEELGVPAEVLIRPLATAPKVASRGTSARKRRAASLKQKQARA